MNEPKAQVRFVISVNITKSDKIIMFKGVESELNPAGDQIIESYNNCL